MLIPCRDPSSSAVAEARVASIQTCATTTVSTTLARRVRVMVA